MNAWRVHSSYNLQPLSICISNPFLKIKVITSILVPVETLEEAEKRATAGGMLCFENNTEDESARSSVEIPLYPINLTF